MKPAQPTPETPIARAQCAQLAEYPTASGTIADSAHCARSARADGDEHEGSGLARALLDIAAEVESAEQQLKEQILQAAADGDCARVIDIVTGWIAEPLAEVLARDLPSLTRSR